MRRIIFAILLLVSLSGIVFAQDSLKFVYTSYVPANYIGSSESHKGFFVDIIREALEKRMAVSVSMSVYPWPRCQYMVRLGQADMMATISTAERREYAVVVETPIWIKRYRLFSVPGHPRAATMDLIRSVEDLARSGLVVLSYSGNDWARTTLEKAGVKVINAPSVEGMYKMLFAGRGDLVIEDPVLVKSTLNELGLSDRIIQTMGIVEESAFHLMLSKVSPYASLADALNRTLNAMWADGTIDAIMSRYR